MWQVIFYAFILSSIHSAQSQTTSCAISAAGSNSPGGVKMSNQNTLALCSSACLAFMKNSTACQYGFDFDKTDNSCWFSTSATTKTAFNVDHYICVEIPVIPPGTCISIDNKNTKNGNAQSQANTLDECKTLCLTSESCKNGFDWDPKGAIGSRCWFSTTILTNDATGVTHYYCIAASNTSPVPPTIGQIRCKKYADTNSPGGTPTPSTVATLEGCIAACYLVGSCLYGFDWVPAQKTCWISTTFTLYTGSTGVEHYNCLQPTTIAAEGGCTWITTENTNTKGGTGQPDHTTIESCRAACLKVDTCVKYGIDWDPAASPKCWFSTTSITQNSNGVTHHACKEGVSMTTPGAVTEKTDLCQWTETTDTSVPGGQLMPNAANLDQCKALCKASTLCLIFGFDWNQASPSGSQCYISNSLTKSIQSGVTHYFWSCSGCNYILYKNMYSPQGVFNPATKLEDCLSACLKSKDCWSYGFDWDPYNKLDEYCWISKYNSSYLRTGTNVSHYLPTCSAVGNATTPDLKPGSNCFWNLQLDVHTLGGILVPTATTLDLCQAACAKSTTCNTFGLDWDVSQPAGRQCYLSTVAEVVASKNVAHYTFSCTVTTTPVAPSATCIWTKLANFHTIGGVLNNANTLPDCQNECKKVVTCSQNGLDFEQDAPLNSRCWISTNDKTVSSIGIDHWIYTCSYKCKYPPICTIDKNSPGGILKAEATTQAECENFCLKFRTQCLKYGYDWVTNGAPGTQCWLSTLDTITSQTGVKHCSFANSECDNPEVTNEQCQWVVDIDKNSPGGTLNNATSLAACQSACLSSESCKKYGFDWAFLQCWLSNNPTLGVYPGVKHYKYICNSDAGQTSPNCWWDTKYNTNSPGGIVQTNIMTDAECRSKCPAATSTCAKYGYDFNINNIVGSQCWYSTTSATGVLAGCTHSVYICKGLSDIPTTTPGASCYFTELTNLNSPGGTLVTTATTVENCKAACAANVVRCAQYGFDWNNFDKTCYLSTSTITSNSNGVSHYNYVCSSSCTWIPSADKNSPGGVLQSIALTLGQCQSLCSQALTSTCSYGFDWDAKAAMGSQCWFSTSTTTGSFPGVTHYTCSGGSTSTLSTSTTSFKLTSKCGWNEYPGRKLSSPAGEEKPTLTTKQTCHANCVGIYTCKAYAWRENYAVKCVFYTVTTLPDTTAEANYIHTVYLC